MDALALLQELTRHMEWADAVVFAALRGQPRAGQDDALLKRLRHLHLVQKVFLDVWLGQPIDPQETDAFSAGELSAFAQALHPRIRRFQEALAPADLDRAVRLPWSGLVSRQLGFEIAEPTLGQTLAQVTAHSAYHRGQANARLRELGVEPPMTDYIAWVWARQPAPPWPEPGA